MVGFDTFGNHWFIIEYTIENYRNMSQQIRTLPTPLSLDDFDVGVTLGTGSFGRVRFATHKVMVILHSTSNPSTCELFF